MIIASPKTVDDIKIKEEIIKLLAYFDMFDHPISLDEMQFFLLAKNKDELRNALQELQNDQYIFLINGFYSLRDDIWLFAKRKQENKLAQPILVRAHKAARFFFRFPYVRGIGISGSLSKNVAQKDSDIDLFVVTKANKLWIARTLMCLYVKMAYLIHRKHLYCLNYFVDEEALLIQEKNVFTAMETITLIPVCGSGTMNNFYKANNWISTYYKGYNKKTIGNKITAANTLVKILMEFLFNNKLGNWLDSCLMKITSRRWYTSVKKGKTNGKGNQFGMKAGKHFSKPDPVFFQEKLLSRYYEKINSLKLTMPELFNEFNSSFVK